MLSQGVVCGSSRGASPQKRCHIKRANAWDEKWPFSIKRLRSVVSYCAALQTDVLSGKSASESAAVADIIKHGAIFMSKGTVAVCGHQWKLENASQPRGCSWPIHRVKWNKEVVSKGHTVLSHLGAALVTSEDAFKLVSGIAKASDTRGHNFFNIPIQHLGDL